MWGALFTLWSQMCVMWGNICIMPIKFGCVFLVAVYKAYVPDGDTEEAWTGNLLQVAGVPIHTPVPSARSTPCGAYGPRVVQTPRGAYGPRVVQTPRAPPAQTQRPFLLSILDRVSGQSAPASAAPTHPAPVQAAQPVEETSDIVVLTDVPCDPTLFYHATIATPSSINSGTSVSTPVHTPPSRNAKRPASNDDLVADDGTGDTITAEKYKELCADLEHLQKEMLRYRKKRA